MSQCRGAYYVAVTAAMHGVWPCGRRWKGRAWQLWCGAAMEGAPMEGDAGIGARMAEAVVGFHRRKSRDTDVRGWRGLGRGWQGGREASEAEDGCGGRGAS